MSSLELKKWDVVDHLKTEEDMRLYLDACIEEDAGDGALIRAALSDIARARNMTQLAKDAGMSREGLYKALSPEGNPSFATVLKVARALGLDLRFATVPSEAKKPGKRLLEAARRLDTEGL